MERGDRIGWYEVLQPLKAGGMGEVYLAEDLRSCEKAALKVLPPRFRDHEALRARFLDESAMYQTLAHPNIVRWLGAGTEGEVLYVALEYLRGQDLGQLLHELGRIPADMAVSMMLDMAYALNFAHGKGIIHRDIKPQNVMLTDENVIKLIDFGVARAEAQPRRTQGMVVGSLCYNSPEQNQGRPVDERSDVYSLGLLFYEMLTGERVLPTQAIHEILMRQIQLDDELVPPSQRDVDLPPELEALILRMCRFDPARRPRSMDEVLQPLKRLVEAGSIPPDDPARRGRAAADRDLADTHYWTAMNHIAERQYPEALAEFEAILNLSLFDDSHFQDKVEEQLNLLAWRLQAGLDEPDSTPAALSMLAGEAPEEISNLQMDVLQKLHQIYAVRPHEGIRAAMGNLLSFYKDQLRDDPREARRKAVGDLAIEDYVDVLLRLARLYDKAGNADQRKITLHKVVATLGKVRDPALAADLWGQVAERLPEDPIVLEGHADFLSRRGDKPASREVRRALARQLERRGERLPALHQWRLLAEGDPSDSLAAAGLAAAQAAYQEGVTEARRLFQLLAELDAVTDHARGLELCQRYLDRHPPSAEVLDRRLELLRAAGDPLAAAEAAVALGKLHYDQGDRAAARRAFAAALRGDPDSREATEYLVDILREDDPSLCDRSSPQEVRRELFVRLAMPDQATRDLRAKLKGTSRDLDRLARIEEIYRRCKDEEAASLAARDRVQVAIELREFEAAREAASRFQGRYPERRDLLRPLANMANAAEDHALMALLVH